MASFIYCLNSSTIMPTPILEKIQIAGEVGYAAIELWHSDIDSYLASGGKLSDITNALSDQGLDVPTTIFLKGWWDTVGAVYEREMDEVKRRLEQAQQVSATYAIAGPPLGAVDIEVGAKNYRRLIEVGREFGVKPVMEYLGFAAEVNSIEVALQVMEGSGDTDATTVLDPWLEYRTVDPGVAGSSPVRRQQLTTALFVWSLQHLRQWVGYHIPFLLLPF